MIKSAAAQRESFGFVDRVAVLLQRDVLRRKGETEIGQPAAIRSGPPGASRIATTLAEEERFQPMLGLRGQANGIFPCPHEITQGFIRGRGDVDRRELAGAMQSGQRIAIPTIGLDPIAAPLRHARGIDDDAILLLRGEVPVDSEPTWARFVHKLQPPVRRAQRPEDLRHRLEVTGDHPVMPDLAVSPFLGNRDVNRFFVDIHPHEHATFRHGLPPLYVALRGTLIGVA